MKIFASWLTWQDAERELVATLSPERLTVMRDAYTFAAARHRDQRRPAGEPYPTHLLEVTEILIHHAGITMSDQLAAAMLHDVVEDTPCTMQEVRERFGVHVAELVDWLTQPSDVTREAYLARLREAPGEALMVKLADRYSNVQRLHTHPREPKQRSYYAETCRAFLPLAARIPAFEPLFADWRAHYRYLDLGAG